MDDHMITHMYTKTVDVYCCDLHHTFLIEHSYIQLSEYVTLLAFSIIQITCQSFSAVMVLHSLVLAKLETVKLESA